MRPVARRSGNVRALNALLARAGANAPGGAPLPALVFLSSTPFLLSFLGYIYLMYIFELFPRQ